ncbi:transposase [Mannheimia haemolytica]|nr:transposase [Mannheimia haemolytica]MDW0835095.1 transposase [Mannheimia haemolytica]
MRKSRLSQYKQNKLIEQFVAGVTARTASELVNVNKNTAAYYFHRLRLLIYQHSPHLEIFNHFRINHSTHFAENQNHINGIENFGSQAKRHLRKFNGIPKVHFELYLKECEWRFNHSDLKSQISFLKQLVKGSLG